MQFGNLFFLMFVYLTKVRYKCGLQVYEQCGKKLRKQILINLFENNGNFLSVVGGDDTKLQSP